MSARAADAARAAESAGYRAVVRLLAALPAGDPRPTDLRRAGERLGLPGRALDDALAAWGGLDVAAFCRAVSAGFLRRLAEGGDLLGRPASPVILPATVVSVRQVRPGDAIALATTFAPSPFGETLLVTHEGALAGLGFVDDGDRSAALADMRRRWPSARFLPDPATGLPHGRLFDPQAWSTPVPLAFLGGAFDAEVWQGLLAIPVGRATTYSDLAAAVGRPGAARAVGAAVGRNPVSFVVPCHRVLGRDGRLTGYHWGVSRKHAMLVWEAGLCGCA